MSSRESRPEPRWLIAAAGVALLALAGFHHLREAARLGTVTGPALAFLLDGLPAAGLAGVGYWLGTRDLPADRQARVAGWCLVGGVLWVSILGASVAVRSLEGRPATEPAFELLLAADAGGLAGTAAGYFYETARRDERRARRATEALSFVNGVLRHDLRNDLVVVRGRAQFIEDGAGREVDRDNAAIIREQADEAAELVESTGAIAETLAGDAALEPVDLSAVVADAVERAEAVGGAAVSTDLAAGATVPGNDGLYSVVDNLLENAVEHAAADRPEDGAEDGSADPPRIEVSVRTAGDTVRLRVADDGPGVPEDERGTLFDARADGVHGGGLHLVGALLEAYGGSIRVEEGDLGGAAFVAELPRAGEEGA